MKKIITIIGARPQFIKSAAISRAIKNKFGGVLEEYIVHTGQHYDASMSEVFFTEMDMPKEDVNLHVGSGSHGMQTARMLQGIEECVLREKPDAVLVFGDTNSTLSGALAASKVHIPLIHIEAGLRSFNKKMPEELNRIVADQCASLLFVPTKKGLDNLRKEGFDLDSSSPFSVDNPGVFHIGDVMLDNSLYFRIRANDLGFLEKLGIKADKYILATVHRPFNTDKIENLNAVMNGLIAIGENSGLDVLLPLHPRTDSILRRNENALLLQKIERSSKIRLIPPTSYLEMIALESNARLIVTDSGGVQKEAYFFQKPCVILREETEWMELVDNGNSVLAGADTDLIVSAVKQLSCRSDFSFPEFYGNGEAAEEICQIIVEFLS